MQPKPEHVVAIYPGSFDPITTGHMDLIERGSRLFDRLIVSILRNEKKEPLFSVEERAEMLLEAVKHPDGAYESPALPGTGNRVPHIAGSAFVYQFPAGKRSDRIGRRY